MKYLDILKQEIPLPTDTEKRYQSKLQKLQKGSKAESEKTENTYHGELQKVQKGVFTVFAVQEGSTFPEKRAHGYGCSQCGGKTYYPAEIWVTHYLQEPALFEWEHSLVKGWKCDQCGSEFLYIGGTKGPQPIN